MVPAQLMPLLWLYCRCEPVPDCIGGNGHGVRELRDGGYIIANIKQPTGYDITAKGLYFLNTVFDIKEPICIWVQP